MISKVKTGQNFYGCCRYVCSKLERAVILEADGVRTHDYKLMAADFEFNRLQRPSKAEAVFHGILSFYPGEKLDDATMASIGKEYLEAIGITNTQYAITKHIDKAHPHLHIIANMVNYEGKSIKDNWLGLRGKKVAQQLTKRYGLVPAIKKDIALTNLQSLNNEQGTRYDIYQTINTVIPGCNNLNDLQNKLKSSGIETQYKYKNGTEELQGISFKKDLFCFKGSSIDRSFSIGNLQKILLGNSQMQGQNVSQTTDKNLLPKKRLKKKRGHGL